MSIGFNYGGNPSQRTAIFGERIPGRVGYVQRTSQGEWFCDANGRRIARVTRWKPYQAPQAGASIVSGQPLPRPEVVE